MDRDLDGLGALSYQDICRELGISNISQISTPNQYAYDQPIDGPSGNIASGGAKVLFGSFTSDAGYAFCVQELAMELWPSGAYLTNVPARTPATMESGSGTGSGVNDMMYRSMFSIEVFAGQLRWFDGPQAVSLCAGTVARPAILNTRRWIPPATKVDVYIYNNSTASANGQISFKGFRKVVPRFGA